MTDRDPDEQPERPEPFSWLPRPGGEPTRDAAQEEPRPGTVPSPREDPPPTEAIRSPAEPPPTEAIASPPSEGRHEPPPTELTDVPTQAWTPPPVVPPPAAGPPPAAPTERIATGEDAEPSPIDELFAEHRFEEVAPGPDPNEAPFPRRPPRRSEPVPPGALGRSQKVLLAISGALVAILALIALYLLGTRLPELLGPAPAVIQSPTPSPSASVTGPVELPPGPQPPGEYAWHELLGGECLEPYTDAWAQTFTVVECSEPHTAQLTYRGSYWPAPEEGAETPPPLPPFPGVETLQSEISSLCSVRGVVDLDAAREFDDARMQGSYPATEEEWTADPSYYCFFTLASGERFDRSVAVPPAE